jgi:plasmid stability protein
MATLTVRNLPDDVRDKLRVRAARNGRSMEAEARQVIAEAMGASESTDLQAEWKASIREAQEAFAPYRNPKVSAVDELIAERRLEASRETVEAYEWLSRNGDKKPRRNARS